MLSKGLAITILLGLLSVGATWWSQNRSLTNEERLLFNKLDTAISSNPPLAYDVIEAFSLPQDCRAKTCWLDARSIGALQYSEGDLRHPGEGIIFQLEGFSKACIRTQRVQTYFGTQEPYQACSHGGCWYTGVQYAWGILTFGLEDPSSPCVSSVVINSLPYQRPTS